MLPLLLLSAVLPHAAAMRIRLANFGTKEGAAASIADSSRLGGTSGLREGKPGIVPMWDRESVDLAPGISREVELSTNAGEVFVTGFPYHGLNLLGHKPSDATYWPSTGYKEKAGGCPSLLQPVYHFGGKMTHRAHCGICQLRANPIVYGFGSNNGGKRILVCRLLIHALPLDFRWEDKLRKVRRDTKIFVFDPTLDQTIHQGAQAQRAAKQAGYNFVAKGLAYREGKLKMCHPGGPGVFKKSWKETYPGEVAPGVITKTARPIHVFTVPVTTLDKLMAELGHDEVATTGIRPVAIQPLFLCW